ncbi:MAG: hypothetical protein GQ475_00065 [Methylococcaceae bacterium]|nr:hypothetical protein [Methylococcaceae bacterium]
MSNNFRIWKLKKWLTIEDAAGLVVADEPSKAQMGNKDEWDAIHGVLSEALRDGGLSAEDIKQPPEMDIGPFDHVYNQTLVRASALTEWFVKNNFHSDFFNPDTSEQTVITKPKLEYQTRLMSIMYDTIERYYGDNYDPDDRDSVPRQVDVIEWLVTNYSLSEVEAKAIDKMTRPKQLRNPQGKK